MKVRTAVIPAAGLGTRFLPVTKSIPKEMLPIVDRPTVELNIEECVKAGIKRVVIVNGRNKPSIENHFDHNVELEAALTAKGKSEELEKLRWLTEDVEIVSVRQKRPLGLGHAVACAAPVAAGEPVAVLLGDDLVCSESPAIGDMMEHFETSGRGCIGVVRIDKKDSSKYGMVAPKELAPDGPWQVSSLVEKPAPQDAPSDLAIIGRYVLPAEIWPLLAELTPGVGGELQLTDALDVLARSRGLDAVEMVGERLDAGDVAGFILANVRYALLRPELKSRLVPALRKLIDG